MVLMVNWKWSIIETCMIIIRMALKQVSLVVLLGCLALCVLQRLVNAEEKSSPRDCYRSCARIVLFWRHKHLFFVLISLALIVWQHPPDLRKLWKLNPGLCLTKIILGLCSISFNIFLYWTISLLHCSQRLRLNLNFIFQFGERFHVNRHLFKHWPHHKKHKRRKLQRSQ